MAHAKTYYNDHSNNSLTFFFKSVFDKVQKHFEMNEAEARLLEMDDRLLKDLGITRTDIRRVVHSGK